MARLTRILLCTGVVAGLLSASGRLWAQAGTSSVPFELASLREDVRLLSQKVGDLNLRIEQLERENRDLQSRNTQSYVTLAQLNQAIAEVNRTALAAQNENRRETLAQVNGMLEKLAGRTNAAIEALAKGMATRAPVAAPTFSGDFPRQGVDYTVQKGDTLSAIAQKMNSSVRDIINANKIADPNNLQVGQTIFIPQSGK